MGGDELPAGWSLSNLGEVAAHFESGKRPKGGVAKYTDGVVSLGGEHLRSDGTISTANAKYVPVSFAKTLDRVRVRTNDILIVKDGATTGKTSIASSAFADAVINEHLFQLRPVAGVDAKFLFYFLWSEPGNAEIMKDFRGSAQGGITKAVLNLCLVPLAPLPEQQRIVEKIESLFAQLDKGEEALREVQKLLARYRQSVLKAAVTGELTAAWRAANGPPKETGEDLLARILKQRRESWQRRGKYKEPLKPNVRGLPDLPDGWAWASIDQVTIVFRNGLSKKPQTAPNEFPILRISAVRPMEVSFDDLRYYSPDDGEGIDDSWVSQGDLLFTRYNGSGHLVGVCGLVQTARRVLHPDKLIRATPVNISSLSSDFLELSWNTGATRRHIEANTKTTSGQQGIAGGDIKAAPFPLPPANEQEVIAELVSDALARIRQATSWCEAELKRSAALRQSILKDAFSGKLVPQEPSDEPAAKLLERIHGARSEKAKPTRKKAIA